MGEAEEYRCFIGGLAWATTDRGLKDAFDKYGHLLEARVAVDKFSGRSRGFGFISFEDKQAMEEAIEEMHGKDLDGRSITVEKAQPNQGGGRDRDDRPRDRDRGRDRDRDSRGGGRGSGGGDCFRCGKPGHFARECPSSEGGRGGDRYGSRDGGRDDRYGSRDGGRDDRYGSRDGGRDDRYGSRDGGGSRYGPDRNGDRYGGGRSKDSGGGDRYSRERSGPYDRRSAGGFRG